MARRVVSVLLLIAVANQALWSLTASQGLLFHRHGTFGFHAHLLDAQDDAEAAANSPGWGHRIVREDGSTTSGVILLLIHSEIQPPPTESRAAGNESLGPIQPTVNSQSLSAADAFALLPRSGRAFGECDLHLHSPGIRGILQSGHSILI